MKYVYSFVLIENLFGNMIKKIKILSRFSSSQIQGGEGKVYKCLFNHKFEEAMSEKVRPTRYLPPPPG